jgi:cell pole-organizing protein PopZ
MSRSEATGESLESILASIRRSLSEQSTDILEEEVAPLPAEEPSSAAAERPGPDGLGHRLADTDSDVAPPHPQVEAAAPVAPQVSDRVEAPPPPAAAAPARTQALADPLWFLGARGQAKPAPPAARVDAKAQAPAKAGVVRGPLPPFFGSSAEAQKTEVVLVQPPPASGPGVLLPPAPPPAAKAAYEHSNELDTAAPMPPPAPAPVDAAEPLRNGRANALSAPTAADGKPAPGGDSPHVNALEAMVAELLRPMLQRWLDENMPRLISAALKDEASRLSARDPKKP